MKTTRKILENIPTPEERPAKSSLILITGGKPSSALRYKGRVGMILGLNVGTGPMRVVIWLNSDYLSWDKINVLDQLSWRYLVSEESVTLRNDTDLS